MFVKNIKLFKVLTILMMATLILALDNKSKDINENNIIPLNQAIDSSNLKIDFMCYNMCKETTKGLNVLELDIFCKKQCSIKN